jgi:hypothetical protein
MKKTFSTIALVVVAATSAHATQETFTSAGPLSCSAIQYCIQNTADGRFQLSFAPTFPTSAPSASGFDVRQDAIEVYNANGGLLDLNGMQVTLTGSESYNGITFLGAIQLEILDPSGTWTYVTQWSTTVSATKGVYVLFNGRTANAPKIQGVQGIRLSGVNGATAFRIGMLNLTAR